MKKFVIVIGIIMVIGLLIMRWVMFSDESEKLPNQDKSNFPVSTTTQQTNTTNILDIKNAFQKQVEAPIPRTLGNTYVVSEYAIQEWTDGYSGGEILFRQSPDKKEWIKIGADSVWSVEYLIKAGVPANVANELFQAKNVQ